MNESEETGGCKADIVFSKGELKWSRRAQFKKMYLKKVQNYLTSILLVRLLLIVGPHESCELIIEQSKVRPTGSLLISFFSTISSSVY